MIVLKPCLELTIIIADANAHDPSTRTLRADARRLMARTAPKFAPSEDAFGMNSPSLFPCTKLIAGSRLSSATAHI